MELDLEANTPYQVLVYDHGREGGREDVIHDGSATFSFTPLPFVRRLGHRWEGTVRAGTFAGTFVVADPAKGHVGYQPGGTYIEVGERYLVELVERSGRGHDGQVEVRDALEMALEVFELTEGVEVRFA